MSIKHHSNENFLDNNKLTFGTSDDFQIVHDGTDTTLTNATGDLIIEQGVDDKDIILKSDNGSGGTTAYLTIDGSAATNNFNKSTFLPDDNVHFIGNSYDLRIYHSSSSASYIHNDTGHLYIENDADDSDIIFRSDDGSGSLTAYLTLDGSAGFTVADKKIRYKDSVEAAFGSSDDMMIKHDGSDGFIQNYNGDLYIRNNADDKDIIFQSDDGNGGIATYFFLDGSQSTHDGSSTTALYTEWHDNSVISLGSSRDLRIYHSGTSTFISNYTGNFYIDQNLDDGDIIFRCDDGSGGITEYFRLDGGAAAMVASKSIYMADDKKFYAGGGGDLGIYHNGSNSFIENATGDLTIDNGATDKDIIFKGTDTQSSVATDITALTLDMSEQGKAIFNSGANFSNTVTIITGGPKLNLQDNTDDDDQQINFVNNSGVTDYMIRTSDPTGGGGGDGFYIGSVQSDGEVALFTHNTTALTLDTSQNATFAAGVTVTGNITANGNIVGDDSTAITNISSIGADTYAADADSTTRFDLSSDEILCLIQDEDCFSATTSGTTFHTKLIAKNRVLAKTTNSDANFDGDVVYFGGTTSMDAGKIYYLNSSGNWALADADAESTAKGMLGVALGAASDTNGVLIRGMVTLDHDPGTIGDTVFLSTTAGQASSTAPSGNGDIIRVVGYCLDSTNGQIYFNPDGTFVEVSA